MEYIDKKLWHTCKICGQKIQNLSKIGEKGKYYTYVFKQHLKNSHNMDINQYFEDICNIYRPYCSCGVCNKTVDIANKNGSNFRWKKYKCGLNNGVKIWSEIAKTDRCGIGNPMYGKDAWNKSLTKETSESIKRISEKRKGTKTPQHVKNKQSESAKKRIIHGHTGHFHTNENKEKCRERTLQMIKNGRFKQNKSKPFIEFGKILEELKINYESEKIIKYWSFDYYLIEHNYYIEIDGDYFHSNPKIYPDGPKTKTQKINNANDKRKNCYCKNNNINIYRFWESDILTNREEIKCKLRELLELDI